MYKLYLAASMQENNVGVKPYGTEEERMFEFCDLVEAKLKKYGKTFTVYRNKKDWDLDDLVKDVNKKKCDLFVDVHTNAAANPQAQGTEVYFNKGSVKGKKFAAILYKWIAVVSYGRDRGIRESEWLYTLKHTNCPAALVELFFHSNKQDVDHYLANKDIYVRAFVRAVCEYFGVVYIVEPKGVE